MVAALAKVIIPIAEKALPVVGQLLGGAGGGGGGGGGAGAPAPAAPIHEIKDIN